MCQMCRVVKRQGRIVSSLPISLESKQGYLSALATSVFTTKPTLLASKLPFSMCCIAVVIFKNINKI